MNGFFESRCSCRSTELRGWIVSIVLQSFPGGPLAMVRNRKLASCIRAVFALALLSTPLAAQIRGSGDPFQVGFLSTFTTLPGADGLRLVGVSFRITNTSTLPIAPLEPATVTIAFGTNSATFNVPALAPGVTAYVSRTVETASAQVAVSITITGHPVLASPNQVRRTSTPVTPLASTPPPKAAATPQDAPLSYTVTMTGEPGRWQSVGPSQIASSPPETGRVTTIAIDPRNPEIVYAGARGSGLWKTLGIRTVWLPMTDSLPTQEIDAVALDPNNPDHVVIATGAGVFESLTDGNVWTQLTPTNLQAVGSDGGKLLIARGPNPAMYVTTSNGVLVSTDGGHTWNPVLGSGAAGSIQFSTSDPTQLFATLDSPQPGVFQATNGGTNAASWHQLHGCPSAPLPQFPGSSNVWISESQGAMWVSFRAGSADNDQLGFFSSTAATCTVNGFTEHGWQKVTLSGGCSDFLNNWSYLFVDPNDPSIIYKGGVGLCRITGSGTSSSLLPNIHADQHAIAVAPSNASIVYFGCDGGIYRSNDQGKTLSFFGQGMSNTEFLGGDVDGTGFAIAGASQDNDVESWDGSSSSVWKSIDNSFDAIRVSVDQASPAEVYWMSQSSRQIFHQTTQIGEAPLADCNGYSEFPAEVFVGMISTGTNPAIYTTCNGLWTGPPWQQQVENASGNFNRLGFIKGSPSMVVAATSQGEVFYGIAGQPPLAKVFAAPGTPSASSITFASQSTFYVSMNAQAGGKLNGVIYQLQCLAGCTSQNVWPGNTNGEITAITIDPLVPNSLLAAIRNQGIFRGVQRSGGWTWTPYNNGLPAAITITDLKARSNGSIAAVSYGRGAYTVTTGGLVMPNVVTLLERNAVLALSRLGLVPKVSFQKACINPGDVLAQRPPAGTLVQLNSTVNLTVDSGTPSTCVIK